MKYRLIIGFVSAFAAISAFSAPRRANSKVQESDVASQDVRKAAVASAIALAKVETPQPLPETLPHPFNPPAFGRVAREPVRDTTTTTTTTTPRATGDREILAEIARHVTPSGTFGIGGVRYLQFSKKRLKVGDNLTVTHEGQDYVLELTAIDATNFTLRLNREEITRPIKPGKNP
jgi:hypothetical protein